VSADPNRPLLEQGEKIVWQSRGGGPAGWSTWVYVVATLVGLHVCGALMGIPIILAAAGAGLADQGPAATGDGTGWLAALPSLLCTLVSVAFIGGGLYVAIRPRLRPSYFLTPTRVIAAKLWGGFESWPLARVREARQYVAVYHGRYGERREVVTNRVELVLDTNAVVRFGPVADVQGLLDLFEHAVATRWIELSALPEVDGALAPGEARGDVLFVARTSTAAMPYGPLFVGPTKVLRFTEVPEAHLLGRLYSLLARPGTAAEAEELVLSTARTGNLGHFVEVAREGSRPSIDGTTVSLRLGERVEPVVVSQRDADRARAFLRGRSA
jgi:hypothetical protein